MISVTNFFKGVLGFAVLASGAYFGYYKFLYKDPSVLYVGVSTDYRPFAFRDKTEIVGIDIDISRLIAESLGKKIEFKETDFPFLMLSLQSKKIDMAVSGISPTEERRKFFDFSEIYFRDSFCFLTKNKKFDSYASLSGAKVGVQHGSVVWQEAVKRNKNHKLKIVAYNLNTQIVKSLDVGHIDAMLIAKTEGKEILGHEKDLVLIDLDWGRAEGAAIAINKGDEMLDSINKILQEAKSSGKLDEIFKKFGASE